VRFTAVSRMNKVNRPPCCYQEGARLETRSIKAARRSKTPACEKNCEPFSSSLSFGIGVRIRPFPFKHDFWCGRPIAEIDWLTGYCFRGRYYVYFHLRTLTPEKRAISLDWPSLRKPVACVSSWPRLAPSRVEPREQAYRPP
jgi:hypothetical protein